MKRLLIVIFIALLSIVSVIAEGVDDQGQPNDPATNDRANACFEGGSMENVGCSTEWEWTCGWHLIRWEADGSYEMPSTCRILLPPAPVVVEVVGNMAVNTSAGCMITTSDINITMDAEEDQVAVTVASSFTNSCGDEMTPTVQTVTNSYQSSSNTYNCDTAGSPYEIRVTWSSVSGSYTEFWTGDCVEEIT